MSAPPPLPMSIRHQRVPERLAHVRSVQAGIIALLRRARGNLEVGEHRTGFAEQRADLRNQIALEVKTAAAILASARQQVDVANLGVNLAQEEVTQARDRFAAGVADNIEVISAQDALARANDNQVAALYRYNQARADLARATGQIELLYTGKKTN